MLGVGYDTIGDILNANLALRVLIVVMLAKAVALVISLGSGTSGGLLAPMFMSSAALGGVFAMGMDRDLPRRAPLGRGVCFVAMGAVFGAASRATFTFIVFAFEITRDYNSVLPLMLVSVIADGSRHSAHAECIHHDGETDPPRAADPSGLRSRCIATDVGIRNHGPKLPTFPLTLQSVELAERITRHEPEAIRHQGMVLLDGEGKLAGIITRGDVLRALDQDPSGVMRLHEAGSRNVIVTYPDETLHEAAAKMLRNNIGRLPVVDRKDPRHVVGYLGRPGSWQRGCAVWMMNTSASRAG